MSHLILIDEPALKDCIESNIYQSCGFETGLNLAKALGGDQTIKSISLRITPTWRKDTLYLLQSRSETGYLLFNSAVFEALGGIGISTSQHDDVLTVFQRTCRFALKIWNGLMFAPAEKWMQGSDCGVTFPFPLSKHSGFRVVLRRGYADPRYTKRHGSKHLFAFDAGTKDKMLPNSVHEGLYKKAFEELTGVRTSLAPAMKAISEVPSDMGYHALILSDPNHPNIGLQTYVQWLSRLTIDQKRFVESTATGPQRVEGPAGTGKTLCLILRAYFLCRQSERLSKECRVLFVSHSEATRHAISVVFDVLGDASYHLRPRTDSAQSIELCTLQQWCGNLLGNREIANSQYLDQDALQAKEQRKLFLIEVVRNRLAADRGSLEYLSAECKSFFENEDIEYIAELLQHEIGVQIKGRASESLEAYLELPSLSYCLPTKSANDRRFVFSLYNAYQKELNNWAVFDTDDIILSSLGRLDTPIWRRRRLTEGYDYILIDETHLFNLNELSVFHHLLRVSNTPAIAFSIDRSQAPGERGITNRLTREVLTGAPGEDEETKTQVVFRSSPQIVRLAEAVTYIGASLFTTFENPLTHFSSVITASDEELAQQPKYWKCATDEQMCSVAVNRAKLLCNSLKCRPSDILVVGTTKPLIESLKQIVEKLGSRCVEILHRGDLEAVRKGVHEKALIFSHPDYVGGLEFKAVLIVGVDEGRMPATEGVKMNESRHFVGFKACNRLYVAITRARLVADIFYCSERGISSLLQHAIDVGAIDEVDSQGKKE